MKQILLGLRIQTEAEAKTEYWPDGSLERQNRANCPEDERLSKSCDSSVIWYLGDETEMG
jgi:hypothetical protein